MADVRFYTTELVYDGTIGSRNVTISGIGTPKAVIAIHVRNYGTDEAAVSGDIRYSIGFYDGTRNRVVASTMIDGGIASQCDRQAGLTNLVEENGSTAYDLTATGFVTDGVTVNLVGTGSQGVTRFIFICGDDVTAYANASSANTTTIGTTGITPELVFGACNGVAIPDTSTNAFLSFGVAYDNGASIEQSCLAFGSADNQGTASNGNQLFAADFISQNWASGTWARSVSSMTSGSFELDAPPAGGDEFIYLALNLSGHVCSVSNWDTTDTTLSASFTPAFAIGTASLLETLDTNDTTTKSSYFGIFATDGTRQGECAFHFLDGATTMRGYNATRSDDLFGVFEDTGTVINELAVASFSSFSGSGTNLSYSVSDATQRLGWVLQVETNAAVGGATIYRGLSSIGIGSTAQVAGFEV